MRIILSSVVRKDQSAMSQYRWVMAAIAGLLMTTSFISLTSLSWQESYYITGIIMVAGALIYFIFAKDSTAHTAHERSVSGTAAQ